MRGLRTPPFLKALPEKPVDLITDTVLVFFLQTLLYIQLYAGKKTKQKINGFISPPTKHDLKL